MVGIELTLDEIGYYVVNMFASFYAALDNPTGAPGGLMFRRRAYELLGVLGQIHMGQTPCW